MIVSFFGHMTYLCWSCDVCSRCVGHVGVSAF